MEPKERDIIEKACKLFMKNGIKSQTMDDIARELGISKKTLYIYVNDKDDLVEKSLTLHFEDDKCIFEKLNQHYSNAIDEMFELSQHVTELLKGIHPSIHYDLKKFHPKAFTMLNENRSKFVYKMISENMEKGVAEGFYRQNLNIPIIARLYIARIDIVFDGEVFPPGEFNFADVYLETLRYHLRGIASIKGTEYLVSKFQNINK